MNYTTIERALTKMVKKHHPGLAVVHFDTPILHWLSMLFPHRYGPTSNGLYIVIEGTYKKLDYATLFFAKIDPACPDWDSPILSKTGRLKRPWKCLADFILAFNQEIKKLAKEIKKTHKVSYSACNYITGELEIFYRAKNQVNNTIKICLDYNRRSESFVPKNPNPTVSVRVIIDNGRDINDLRADMGYVSYDTYMFNLKQDPKEQLATVFAKIKASPLIL